MEIYKNNNNNITPKEIFTLFNIHTIHINAFYVFLLMYKYLNLIQKHILYSISQCQYIKDTAYKLIKNLFK